ncbi:AAA family ATPase [Herbiconiux sp. CPCC 205763]|uniref:AAA family ATPase n=1 Tax=Herbiconiux aconitum TaxID=2970913 RepID=A0ABT2GYZ9_9MICO|nr:LuxR family transcriptional regulator [Herbiconiux aconitum]MCS5720196.1 AAA family ATPase [Herbiconiux aconitum]
MPFIARQHELAVLSDFLSEIPRHGSAIHIIGEKGIGKSRLVQEASLIASRTGIRVLTMPSGAADGDTPYAALNELLHPLLTEPAEVSEQHRAALTSAFHSRRPGVDNPLVLYTAVLRLLDRSATRQPLLIVGDDTEQLDAASAAALSFVARRLRDSRVGVILVSARVTNDDRSSGLRELRLGRLDDVASARLVGNLAPHLPHRERQEIARRGGGNPLAIAELVRFARIGWEPTERPALAEISSAAAPFLHSVEALPAATQDALLLVAVARDTDLAALRAAGLEVAALQPAEHAGIVVVDARTRVVSFTHPLTPVVLLRSGSRERIRRSHLAFTVDERIPLRERAYHLAEATSGADERVAGLLESSARASAYRGDLDAAASDFERAARLSPRAGQRRRRLALSAFSAVGSEGDHEMRSSRLEELTDELAHGPGSLYAAVATAHAGLTGGLTVTRASHIIRHAVESGEHGWHAGDGELIDALGAWLDLLWAVGDEREWDSYFSALDRLRPTAPEPLQTLSIAFADTLRMTGAQRDDITSMLMKSDQHESAQVLRATTAAIFMDALDLGVPPAARQVAEGRRNGHSQRSLRSLAILALREFQAGSWDDAASLVGEARAVEDDPPGFERIVLHYVGGLLSAGRGDAEGCERSAGHLDEMGRRLGAAGLLRFGVHIREFDASGRGDWEEAYRLCTTTGAPGTFPRYVPQSIWWAFDLVEAAMKLGRLPDARAHLTAMEREDFAGLSPRLAILASAARGLVTDPDGNDFFERALGDPTTIRFPFDTARVHLAYGTHLRSVKQSEEARDHLRAALSTFEGLGARPWVDRARDELRAGRAGSAIDATVLTAPEQAVAALAAQGLSNREIAEQLFLSPRTVSRHLYRVFPKLGISSRAALRDALQSHDQ